jgi:hypothetical protein
MIFRRTSSGLSNQHLFFDVDAIVLIEGGKSYSKDEVYEGKFDARSIDIKFWRGIFDIYHKSERLQFRAIGSKATLISIVQDIENGDVKNVYVAMDRDFDSINERLFHINGIFYTYGYSWENDVWQPEVLQDVFQTICVIDNSSDDIKDRILSAYNKFAEDIKIAVSADALLSKRGGAFIPRTRHRCCLVLDGDHQPAVNIEKINQLLIGADLSKQEVDEFRANYNITSIKDCFGHLLSDFCYFIIIYFLKNICKKVPKIAKYYITSIGIDKFFIRLKANNLPNLDSYYDVSFSSLK